MSGSGSVGNTVASGSNLDMGTFNNKLSTEKTEKRPSKDKLFKKHCRDVLNCTELLSTLQVAFLYFSFLATHF